MFLFVSRRIWDGQGIRDTKGDGGGTCAYAPCMEYLSTFTYIYHKNQPNVGRYSIHGSYGHFAGGMEDVLKKTHNANAKRKKHH